MGVRTAVLNDPVKTLVPTSEDGVALSGHIPDGGPPLVPPLLVALLLLVPLPLLVAAVPLPPPQGVAQFSVRHAPRAPSAALLEHDAGVVP
jgi:hypothetical protein